MGTPLSVFQQHIEKIRELNFEIVQQITKEQKQVMICFDDGFRGIWDNRQYFIENNIMPTVFIAVELIGKTGYLTLDEIKTLTKLGFRFQAHGWSHSDLTKFNDSDLKRELLDAKHKLEELTELKITDICFPQGYYSDRVIELSEHFGYNLMYTSDPKPYSQRIKNNLIPRYLVQYSTPAQLKSTLLGGMDCLYSHYYRLHKR
jgi:peptidoglycan/xylan/chitin deacetylase (PgdA/CDA1 family)